MNTIAIAIGHNYAGKNRDRGASANGATEADIVKQIVDTIIKKGIPGFNVIKVPEGLDIKQRNAWVNSRASTLQAYFEFHLDSATPTATGVTTFFRDGNGWARGEAIQYQMEYTRITGLKGRGVKSDVQTRFGRLGAIRDIKIFGLLMELGFITNHGDLKAIKEKGVEGITQGIIKMFAS